jgi:hypothetical protein
MSAGEPIATRLCANGLCPDMLMPPGAQAVHHLANGGFAYLISRGEHGFDQFLRVF